MTTPESLLFIRHGATQPNLAGLRCGGDLDVPLTEVGCQQIEMAAEAIRRMNVGVDLIIASDLQRTQHSARILSDGLGCLPVLTLPTVRERMLGHWNGKSIEETESALRLGITPPGGEANEDFRVRITQALHDICAQPCRQPLVVGSKGVARMLRVVLGLPPSTSARNAEVISFDLREWSRRHIRPQMAQSGSAQ
jgi:probable phosphoglycerate mutase